MDQVLTEWMNQMMQKWPGQVRPLPGEEHYELRVSQRVIEIQGGAGGIELTSDLGQAPANPTEEFLRTVMRGNLLGEGTGGAVLATDPVGSHFQLIQKTLKPKAYSEFLNQVEGFVNHVDFWADQLEKQGAPRGG